MIAAESIGFDIGSHRLVDDVSLCVHAGEICAIAGPNGAGKSTLIGVLSGLLRPSRGTVRLGETPLTQYSRMQLAGQCAVLAQRDDLDAPLLASEVVALGRYPHGDEASYATDAALEAVGLEGFAQRPIHTLSGGERQRVHLARVLAQLQGAEGGVLLLDEPTSAQDLAQQHRVLRIVGQLAKERGIAVVAVLHDLNLAGRWADSLLLMREGSSLAVGPIAEVMTTENLRRAFGVCAHVLPHPDHERPQVLIHIDEALP
ncbi:MAG: heme ABC transporter ATP-binding protein [Myxococcales bacterium]|nr:heme ABC transporter ATP-binding protein [Myxococcales bacterium]